MIPISLSVTPHVDTQGTPAQVGQAMTTSGLIRIKNGHVQKYPGCTIVGTTLHGGGANVILNWIPPPLVQQVAYIRAVGTFSGLEVNTAGLTSTPHDITPVGYVPPSDSTQGEWTLATWGVTGALIATYSNVFGAHTLYIWTPTLPLAASGIATPQAGAPPVMNGIFVAAPQQQAFAWGAFSPTLAMLDPMNIAWCDVADLAVWTASATNQAGSFRLSSGSVIVSATWFNLVGLFWTDINLWTAQYVGFPIVYGFNKVADSCGLIAPQAWAILGNIVAWMGQNDFFVYEGGAVRVVTCSVRDFLFNNLERPNVRNIHADANSLSNEITWRVPFEGAKGKCNAYVKWSPLENNAWDVWADPVGGPTTPMWVNSWTDEAANTAPQGITYGGNVLQFEIDNGPLVPYNGQGLNSFFETGWFYISEGQEQVFVERVMPDFNFSIAPGKTAFFSNLTMTFLFADELPSNDTDYPVRTYGPYTVTPQTPYLIVRGTGRVMRYMVSCTDPDTFWRNGKHMMRVSITGRSR